MTVLKKTIPHSIASFKNINLHGGLKKSKNVIFPVNHFLWRDFKIISKICHFCAVKGNMECCIIGLVGHCFNSKAVVLLASESSPRQGTVSEQFILPSTSRRTRADFEM